MTFNFKGSNTFAGSNPTFYGAQQNMTVYQTPRGQTQVAEQLQQQPLQQPLVQPAGQQPQGLASSAGPTASPTEAQQQSSPAFQDQSNIQATRVRQPECDNGDLVSPSGDDSEGQRQLAATTQMHGCKISGDATFNTAGRNINIDQRRNVHNVTESQTNNFQGATIRNSTAGVMGNAGHPPAAGPGAPAEQQQNLMGTEAPPRSPLPQTAQQTAANGAPSVETTFEDCEFQDSPKFNAARQDININRQTQEHNSRQEQVNNMQGATIEDSTVAVMGDVNAGNSPVAPGQGRRQTGGASSNNASRSVSRRQELNADNAVITGSIVGVMGNVTMTNGK